MPDTHLQANDNSQFRNFPFQQIKIQQNSLSQKTISNLKSNTAAAEHNRIELENFCCHSTQVFGRLIKLKPKQHQTISHTIALAALAILGHKSAHSFPIGPVIAEPKKKTNAVNDAQLKNLIKSIVKERDQMFRPRAMIA